TLTNVKGIFGPAIAEYVLGYTISHCRHFPHYHQHQQQRNWQPQLYTSLTDKTMVILGTGSIGSHLAKTAAAFGIHTIGVNRTGIPSK
ncbi:NAD(P)-dependent oxidoreductase, partial [Escherichia coli]